MGRGDASKAEIAELRKQLRDARKAVREAHAAEWMVTVDWATPDRRKAMWQRVAKLARVRL